MRDYKISVAIATYNGEKYLNRQLKSVLLNLQENDEVVISDDGSTDNTLNIIKEFKDKRIKLIEGPKEGLIKNFENALLNCTGEIVFLCDQDDYWYTSKVDKILEVFESKNCILVMHDAVVVDSDNNTIYDSFFQYRRIRTGIIKNIFRNTYHGCLMAIRKELIKEIVPFPPKGCLHDQWIGIVAERNGNVEYYNKVLMKYYRHSTNASTFKHLPISIQIINRYYLIKYYIKYIKSRNRRKYK